MEGLPDREKVIRGLECCTDHDHRADCYGCYQEGPGLGFACRESLMRDALALLREQEPVEPIRKRGSYVERCGICGTFIYVPPNRFCPNCGRKVKR